MLPESHPRTDSFSQGGNADAQYYLGRCCEYGKNDNISAREWYIKAADNGNSDAMIKAAMFIAKRRGGGKKNPQMVMGYIQKAIAAGNADGKALLASYYLEGRKDIKKGIQLSKEASDAG
ncbi:MAG: sel1 repeat family protein, partial [Lentisphaeria bacterium]|nr:sel1 repeat family protein [Lentisphaeria bacterium]